MEIEAIGPNESWNYNIRLVIVHFIFVAVPWPESNKFLKADSLIKLSQKSLTRKSIFC